MTPAQDSEERTLQVAERVSEVLEEHGVSSALIGAMALAAHGYPRMTEDVDLATATDPFGVLQLVARTLEAEGFEVKLATPDAQDPLGGVLTVSGEDSDPVQVVNFLNPLAPGSSLGADAVASAVAVEGSRLKVVDLVHLVALKLYAGGPKSLADISELLDRNRDADLEALQRVCRAHGLADDLELVLSRLGI